MNKKNKKRAFTLIETVLVIVVIGIIALITAPLIESAIESWSFVSYRSELWQNAELAFSRMATEIKEVRGNSDIVTANNQTFSFINVAGQDITYSFSGNTLNRNGNPLVSNIEAFSFSYFNINLEEVDSPLVSPMVTDIRVVRLYMVLGPTGRTFTLQTDVHPRNIDY